MYFFPSSISPLNEFDQLKRDLIPYLAFASYSENYQEPKLDEGFKEVRVVNWVFEGTEEERKVWSMWHQIDGK